MIIVAAFVCSGSPQEEPPKLISPISRRLTLIQYFSFRNFAVPECSGRLSLGFLPWHRGIRLRTEAAQVQEEKWDSARRMREDQEVFWWQFWLGVSEFSVRISVRLRTWQNLGWWSRNKAHADGHFGRQWQHMWQQRTGLGH